MSTTIPSGLLGKYTPMSTFILAISSSILACEGINNFIWDSIYPNTIFSGFVFLMYGFNFPDIDVTSLKNENSRSKKDLASPESDRAILSIIVSSIGFMGSSCGYISKAKHLEQRYEQFLLNHPCSS